MRKIVQNSFGGPDVLEFVDVELPVPGPGQVLVEVRAIGVNPADWKIRSGLVRRFGEPPFTIGLDFSGVVTGLGPGVDSVAVGVEVFGVVRTPDGSYAEHLVAPVAALAPKPTSVEFVHAAGLPVAALTAWQPLVRVADVRAGQRVLVHAAAGGIGHLAVQIARARGAYVVGTARAANHAFVRGLGADEVIDYTTTDFATLRDVDVVLDTIGGDYGPRSLDTLTTTGVLIDVVGTGPDRTEVTAKAQALGRRFVPFMFTPLAEDLTAIAELVDAGTLRVVLDQTLPLADVVKAHELIESGRTRGKIVLVP